MNIWQVICSKVKVLLKRNIVRRYLISLGCSNRTRTRKPCALTMRYYISSRVLRSAITLLFFISTTFTRSLLFLNIIFTECVQTLRVFTFFPGFDPSFLFASLVLIIWLILTPKPKRTQKTGATDTMLSLKKAAPR